MTLLTSSDRVTGLLPAEYAELLTKPLTEMALPFDPAISTAITTGAHTTRFPLVDEDASAAWVNEGEEITPSMPTFDELEVTPSKVAGLVPISKEMARDSSPDVQDQVGLSITRALALRVNEAFLGNLAAPAPKGLASVAAQNVIKGATYDPDIFAVAQASMQLNGRTPTAWLMHPSDALRARLAKESDTSKRTLLDNVDTIEGVPVFKHPKVPLGTAWGVDSAFIRTVLREDVELAVSDQAFFSSDRIAVRATMRIGFGFMDPLAIAKIQLYIPSEP